MMQATALMPHLSRSSQPEVWRARVSAEFPLLERYWQCLVDTERRRAARFRIEEDRARFVIARGSLRQLVSQRLGIAACEIEFAENEFGKPCLRDAGCALYFNTSHSGDWVLHAFDSAAPVGIDVEAVRADLADLDQYRQVLSSEELAFLEEVPAMHRAHAFAKTWVRKEAYVKAIGEGVSRPLQDISITSDAAGRPRLLYDRNPGSSRARWQLQDVEVDLHHVACLVYRSDVGAA